MRERELATSSIFSARYDSSSLCKVSVACSSYHAIMRIPFSGVGTSSRVGGGREL